MVETNFLAPSVLAYGRWLLRGLPENAVLLTAGRRGHLGRVGGSNRRAVQNGRRNRQHEPVEPRLVCEADERKASIAACSSRSGCKRGLGHDHLRLAGQEPGRDPAAPLARTIPQPSGPGRFAFAGSYSLLTARDSIADTTVIRRAFDGVRGADFALPVVSPRDRSPVRHTSWIPETVVVAAFHYADLLKRAGRKLDASRAETWAEDFGREAGLPSESVEHLRQFALAGAW